MAYQPHNIWDGPQQTVEGLVTGRYIVNKFGINTDVDGAEDIWNGGGDYTGQPITGSAETITITSSAAATDAAMTIQVYGLSSTYALQEELVTLNASGVGVTASTYWRLFRAKVVTPASGQTSNAGILTGTHTTTTANIFCVIPAGYGQTQIAAYTIPLGYTGYLKSYASAMLDLTSNHASIAIWVREFGGGIRLTETTGISTEWPRTIELYGGVAYPEKTDIRMRCLSVQNANAIINARFSLLCVAD